jgi:tRNA threonylcarbamoyladenosine modification (KEOPS) complex Cgi121 subunit
VSQLQVLAAVNRALHDEHYASMRTKHLHSEIVYALAATQNVNPVLTIVDMQIAEAFKIFGLNDSTKSVIVVKVASSSAEEVPLFLDSFDPLDLSACREDCAREGGIIRR